MEELLKEWYGVLAFVLFDVLAVILIIELTYQWFFKRILDFFTAFFTLIILSPVLFVSYLYALYLKKQGKIERIIRTEKYVGKKGKAIVLHAFDIGKFGKILRVYDVFCGRLSFIGTMLLRAYDIEFLDEDEQERMLVRPGLIHPLVSKGNKETDYDEALAVEAAYANNFSFFEDCKNFFVWLLKKIRIEGNEYLGKTRESGYAETLLKEERISKQDYDAAVEAHA